jgi:cytidylate kinase
LTTAFAEEMASLAKDTQGRHAGYIIKGASKANLKDWLKAHWDLRRKMIEQTKGC